MDNTNMIELARKLLRFLSILLVSLQIIILFILYFMMIKEAFTPYDYASADSIYCDIYIKSSYIFIVNSISCLLIFNYTGLNNDIFYLKMGRLCISFLVVFIITLFVLRHFGFIFPSEEAEIRESTQKPFIIWDNKPPEYIYVPDKDRTNNNKK